MTKETHRSNTPQRFATVASVWIAAAVPVLAMVPTVAASPAAPGIVQVDRPWEQVDVYGMPAPPPPPPPVPAPHGCDNDDCGNGGESSNGGDNSGTGTTTAAATTAVPGTTTALVIAHTPATFESTRSATRSGSSGHETTARMTGMVLDVTVMYSR